MSDHELEASTPTWRIGAVEITRVEERITAVPRDALVAGITDEMIGSAGWAHPYVTDDGRLRLSVHSFVVRSEGTTIVVDTCVGSGLDRPLPCDDGWLDRLRGALGCGLDDVDVVVCTHLHFDHIGWNTRPVNGKRVPTFPRAAYLVTQAELDAALDDPAEHRDLLDASIEPIRDAGLLATVPLDHQMTSEVRLVPSPGHTAGHVSVAISSGDQHALITGDTFHTPLQFAHPDLSSTFDDDPIAAIETRRALIDDHVDRDILVLGTHFAPPTAGHLRTTDQGIEFG